MDYIHSGITKDQLIGDQKAFLDHEAERVKELWLKRSSVEIKPISVPYTPNLFLQHVKRLKH